VAAEAEASDKLKDLIPEGGLIKAAENIVRRANENPITVTLAEGTSAERTVVLDGYAMQKLIRGFSSGLPGWPGDIIQLNRGEFEQAARRLLMRTAVRRKEYSTASFWMLDSGSGITAKRRAEFESDPAVDIVGSTFWHYAAGSPIWEFDLGDDFRQNFETPIPTLIVHGTWDTSTPYENALELAPFFKNGTLVTVKRGSHGAMGEAMRSHPDFREAVSRFLESGDQAAVTAELELPAPKWVVPKSPKN
jgi:pimeloyl-ACP methyl ester carboxylesterase